jgi:hypothetical protein
MLLIVATGQRLLWQAIQVWICSGIAGTAPLGCPCQCCQPGAKRCGSWPWLPPAWLSRDTWRHRHQRTSRHSAEAAGSFGRAGRGPTPPSSTAAPSHTPPRRCLRGVQATQRARTHGRIGMSVYAAVGGPVRAAADTPSLLDCPRARLGYQAAFLPPSARQRARTAAALCPCHWFLSPPHPPHEGFRRSLPLLQVHARAGGFGVGWRTPRGLGAP